MEECVLWELGVEIDNSVHAGGILSGSDLSSSNQLPMSRIPSRVSIPIVVVVFLSSARTEYPSRLLPISTAPRSSSASRNNFGRIQLRSEISWKVVGMLERQRGVTYSLTAALAFSFSSSQELFGREGDDLHLGWQPLVG